MTADTPDPELGGAERQDGAPRPPGTAPRAYPMLAWTPSPTAAEPPPRARHRIFADLGVSAAVVTVIVLFGVLLGLLWSAVTPDVPAVMAQDGAVPLDPQPEQFIAADGWFSLLGLGFGVLVAVVVWVVLRRLRGPVGLVAVALGSLGAGGVAWLLGRLRAEAEYRRLRASVAVGDPLDLPPAVRGADVESLVDLVSALRGSLLLPAFAAVVTYTLLAGWSRYASLRPEPDPTLSRPAPDGLPVIGGDERD